MIKNILCNIEDNILNYDDFKYLWEQMDDNIENLLLKYVSVNFNHLKNTYECNIYYPHIYKIEANCPTCGYRTPQSKQKYSEEFIVKNIEYKLRDLDKYDFEGINCYNKGNSGLRELFIILDYLEIFDLNINVAVAKYENLKYLKKYNINSIIYNPEEFLHNEYNTNTPQFNNDIETKVIKYIKDNMKFKVTYMLTLKYNERHEDIFNIINKIKNYDIDYVEIRGFDPFIDSPEEYNPQYSKEVILKIILLLRLYLPDVKLKIPYATNENNYFDEFYEHGLNIITGIYTKYMNPKLENTHNFKLCEKK